jgi:Na+-transporting methylmalonyl-CoA/oxaloacetate decarboxylase gamma subunit
LYGLQAISAQNGWAMAVTGALIVMTGLSVLSLAISQLYKLVALFEKKEKKAEKASDKKPENQIKPLDFPLADLRLAADQYKPLTSKLGESFELGVLFKLFQECNLPHPHLTIRSFRESGILVPIGEGRFSWKN